MMRHEVIECVALEGLMEAVTPADLSLHLHAALGLSAEEIGVLEPMGKGVIHAEISQGAMLGLPTPLHLTVMTDEGPGIITLKRLSDPEAFGHCLFDLTWSEGPRPSPSMLVNAISEVSEQRLGAESIRAVVPAQGHLLVELDAQASQLLGQTTTLPLSLGREAVLRRR